MRMGCFAVLVWALALPVHAQQATDACEARAQAVGRYARSNSRATRAKVVRDLRKQVCRPAAAADEKVCTYEPQTSEARGEGLVLEGALRCGDRQAAARVQWSIVDAQGTPVPVQTYIQADDEGALIAMGGTVTQLLPRKRTSDTTVTMGCRRDGCLAEVPLLGGSLYRGLKDASKTPRRERNPGVVVLADAPGTSQCVAYGAVGRCDLPARVYVDGEQLPGKDFRLHYLWQLEGDDVPPVDLATLSDSLTRLDRALRTVIEQERLDELSHFVELVLAAAEQARRADNGGLMRRTAKLKKRTEKHIAQVWTSGDFSAQTQQALLVRLTRKPSGNKKKK